MLCHWSLKLMLVVGVLRCQLQAEPELVAPGLSVEAEVPVNNENQQVVETKHFDKKRLLVHCLCGKFARSIIAQCSTHRFCEIAPLLMGVVCAYYGYCDEQVRLKAEGEGWNRPLAKGWWRPLGQWVSEAIVIEWVAPYCCDGPVWNCASEEEKEAITKEHKWVPALFLVVAQILSDDYEDCCIRFGRLFAGD